MSTNIHTAGWYQNHFLAGLTMCEPNQDGIIEWIGEDKNWTILTWLEDGVYENATKEEKEGFISEFLNQ